MNQIKWTRPTRCDNSGPNCVEVGVVEGSDVRYVRNSQRPDGPVVEFSAAEWAAHEESIRAGQTY